MIMLIQDIAFLCVDCLEINKKHIQCNATLIIIPQLIINQFIGKVIYILLINHMMNYDHKIDYRFVCLNFR